MCAYRIDQSATHKTNSNAALDTFHKFIILKCIPYLAHFAFGDTIHYLNCNFVDVFLFLFLFLFFVFDEFIRIFSESVDSHIAHTTNYSKYKFVLFFYQKMICA